MDISRENEIKNYLKNVQASNKEAAKKEHFVKLLERLFNSYKNIREILDDMGTGAEKTVLNIVNEDRVKYGAADTQYDKTIIEFENDLSKTGDHAVDQLKEYLVGNWKSGRKYHFNLISTDCINWEVYVPDYEKLVVMKKMSTDKIQLMKIDEFILTEENTDDFFFFIDRYLFKSDKMPATLENIQRNFGVKSEVFKNTIAKFKKIYEEHGNSSDIIVAYNEWEKFLAIAYGAFKGTNDIFLIHTYLSVLSKMLAYEVISNDDFIDDQVLQGIMTGEIFEKNNISNFTDNDFYHWVSNIELFQSLKPSLREMSHKLTEFDFVDVKEDILKGIYQELIDIETRHSLGEYYTPDWLCESIVNELEIKRSHKFLDPACGSGSFLRAIIDKLIKKYPEITTEELVNQVVGIDIHPLSVQIAKSTILITLNKRILKEKKPVQLKVFLANSLFIPEGSVNLIGEDVKITINNQEYIINSNVFHDSDIFDQGITACEQMADYTLKDKPISKDAFINTLKKSLSYIPSLESVVDGFYVIYLGFKQAKENKQDSIWKFILQNLYKPFFLKEKFDFVIGNPPWLTFSDVQNKTYQDALKILAANYSVVPNASNMPHLEIATIFLSHSSSFFLKQNGKIAFVLPRSFLSADPHNNMRSGKARGYKIESIWDLEKVSPLFRVPSCVVFSSKSDNKDNQIDANGINGKFFKGKLAKNNLHLKQIGKELEIETVKWYYIKLQSRSAFSNEKVTNSKKMNFYKKYFKQGATIVPRNFYFVDITQDDVKKLKNRIITVKTSDDIKKESKAPWKKFSIEGKIESEFLFKTAISKNILPFIIVEPKLVLLPIQVKNDEIKMLSHEKIQSEGFMNTAIWFKKVEKIWGENRTEKSQAMTYLDRIDYQRGITGQDLTKKYLVLYTASAKDAIAAIVSREDFEQTFIVDSKAYWFGTNDRNEALFLLAFLNSNYPNKIIKDFQSKGTFGPRDIHKKILEVPLAEFSNKNEQHKQLVKMAKICEQKILEFTKVPAKTKSLGRIRLNVKAIIKDEIKEIDSILSIICK